ncbi:unnamed protein product [Durusdinium trenchii]|uniref:Poly A polymerase head domain-containing protein n=1 Tax=Durusdinium trenchii TaxID=1381693 RepID=A0ABP0QI19_9DINO
MLLELHHIRRGLFVPIARPLPPRPFKRSPFARQWSSSPKVSGTESAAARCVPRACLAMAAAVATKRRLAVHHGQKLSEEYTCRIPKTDAEILHFFLCFLEDQRLPDVPVFINGGYVRDLLLGKEPDDLDLTLCLRGCPEEVTVAALLDEMRGYVESRPEFGLSEFKNATILSNESKDKQLDTFKAHFTNKDGVKTEVDVMPTIGEEKYSDDNRIPIRDQRGLPEEDALRRDLTIGALLLRVQRAPGERGESNGLEFEVFDFYGGVDDLCKGVLRSPCPVNKSVAEVAEVVLRTPEEQEIAKHLKIQELPPDEAVQVLWWSKVLIDDPLRICRALRFAAKFKFELHKAFWLAVPFALEPLRTKVAGSRKFTEYQKIGGYGFKACFDFFHLAFNKTFGPEGSLRLASALLGGQDGKGQARMLSQVKSFNVDLYEELAAVIKPEASDASDGVELLGELMVAALAATDFEGRVQDPMTEFTTACDGMCVSNAMREAGLAPWKACAALVAEPPEANSLDSRVADACGVSPQSLVRHVQVWEAMKICTARTGPEYATPYRRRLALALAGLQRKDPDLQSCVEALSFLRPPVRGTVLNAKGVLEVPNPLRKQVMELFEVSTRLLKFDAPVEAGESLQKLFDMHPKLQAAFSSSVWMADDGKNLKSEFLPAKRGPDSGPKDGKGKHALRRGPRNRGYLV